ncbi:hypothetical protein CG747_20695 [Streptomyces sp. CB02959]|nr:hypothetical protein CG747_20695 [Streptomyces sp. CB02959]
MGVLGWLPVVGLQPGWWSGGGGFGYCLEVAVGVAGAASVEAVEFGFEGGDVFGCFEGGCGAAEGGCADLLGVSGSAPLSGGQFLGEEVLYGCHEAFLSAALRSHRVCAVRVGRPRVWMRGCPQREQRAKSRP